MAFVARLVGEGYDRPAGDDELPIDINYAKVTEFLTVRKLVPQDWTRKLQVIQSTVSEAAKELPAGLLAQVGVAEEVSVDYFRAQDVLSHLAETADRGLWGSFKGSAGKWERIVKAYEANMLHVAEAGLSMARNVDYEVPYLKKQAAKNQQLMTDLDRRSTECIKSAATAQADFIKECAALGVPEQAARQGGTALQAAVASLSHELPSLLDSTVDIIKAPAIRDAMQYYADFTAAATPTSSLVSLPTLADVHEGQTSPPATPLREDDIRGNGSKSKEAVIQWDDAMKPAHEVEKQPSTREGILWNVDSAATPAPATGISWDVQDSELELAASGHVEEEEGVGDGQGVIFAGTADISWDIDIDVSATGEDGGAVDVVPGARDGAPANRSVVSGAESMVTGETTPEASVEARRIAADAAYRARLLDDMYELRAFLVQRCNELGKGESEGSLAKSGSMADFPAVDAAAASKMKKELESALQALTADRVVLLTSLSSSAAHRERLMSRLARQAGQADKFRAAAADAEARKVQAQRQLVADSGKLTAIVRRTKEVKLGVEKALGGRLGRRINVQGEINNVLSQHAL